jgi:hypothetical protein
MRAVATWARTGAQGSTVARPGTNKEAWRFRCGRGRPTRRFAATLPRHGGGEGREGAGWGRTKAGGGVHAMQYGRASGHGVRALGGK